MSEHEQPPRDPIACLSFAVDAMREAFDLVLSMVSSEAIADPTMRGWYIEAAAHRVIRAARVVRELDGEIDDPRIHSTSERLEAERRAVVALLGEGFVAAIDEATVRMR